MPGIWNIISSTASSEVEIDGVPVTLRVSARARRLRLRVDPRTRKVLLTIPRRVSRRRALAWAAGHRDWIARQLVAIPERVPFEPGRDIPYRGLPRRLDWHPDRPRRPVVGDGVLLAGGPRDGLERRVLRWLKAEALETLDRETRALAAGIGVMTSRVGVGDPVSRWGSCSAGKAIRYSWRLILAPDFVRRSTVAHEVAHLVHLDHGPDFHALAAQLLGEDPRPARDWLRQNGAALHRIGPPR